MSAKISYSTNVVHADGSTTEVLSPPVVWEGPAQTGDAAWEVPLTVGRKYSEPLGRDAAWVSVEISVTFPLQLDPTPEVAIDFGPALVSMRRQLSALLDQEMLAEMECALNAHEGVRVLIADRQARVTAREKAEKGGAPRPGPAPISRPVRSESSPKR